MKIAVLVPSHIYYSDQIERLVKCLNSLCGQTVIPDIIVSISFENDTYKYELSNLIRNYPSVKFKFSAQQKFQMEHLLQLSQLVCNYDMIMFCDDDDTYLPVRVEKFMDAFEKMKEYCDKMNIEFGGVREVKNAKTFDEAPEYWAYGIPPSLLDNFFNRIMGYEDLMRHKFADMYLRNYLKRTGGESIMFATLVPDISGVTMYEYTIDNPNSICMRDKLQKQTTKTAQAIIRDNVTLCLICDRTDLLVKHMDAASAPLSRLNEVVPDAPRIKSLIRTLYN